MAPKHKESLNQSPSTQNQQKLPPKNPSFFEVMRILPCFFAHKRPQYTRPQNDVTPHRPRHQRLQTSSLAAVELAAAVCQQQGGVTGGVWQPVGYGWK